MHIQCEITFVSKAMAPARCVIYSHRCCHSGSPRARTSPNVPRSCRWKPKLARARSFPFTPVSWIRWCWNFQKVAKDRGRNSRNCCAGKLHCNRINHRRATGVAFFSFPFLQREWDRSWPKRQTPDRSLYLNVKTLTGKNNSLLLRCEKLAFSLQNWLYLFGDNLPNCIWN